MKEQKRRTRSRETSPGANTPIGDIECSVLRRAVLTRVAGPEFESSNKEEDDDQRGEGSMVRKSEGRDEQIMAAGQTRNLLSSPPIENPMS